MARERGGGREHRFSGLGVDRQLLTTGKGDSSFRTWQRGHLGELTPLRSIQRNRTPIDMQRLVRRTHADLIGQTRKMVNNAWRKFL